MMTDTPTTPPERGIGLDATEVYFSLLTRGFTLRAETRLDGRVLLVMPAARLLPRDKDIIERFARDLWNLAWSMDTGGRLM